MSTFSFGAWMPSVLDGPYWIVGTPLRRYSLASLQAHCHAGYTVNLIFAESLPDLTDDNRRQCGISTLFAETSDFLVIE